MGEGFAVVCPVPCMIWVTSGSTCRNAVNRTVGLCIGSQIRGPGISTANRARSDGVRQTNATILHRQLNHNCRHR